jgi:hypothetical protein
MPKSVFKIIGSMLLLLLGVSPMASMANNFIDLTDTRSDYNFIDAEFSFQVIKSDNSLPFGNGKKNDTEEEKENEKNEENETEDEVEKNEKRKRLGFFYALVDQVAYLLYFQTQTFARQAQQSYALHQAGLSIYLLNHCFRN